MTWQTHQGIKPEIHTEDFATFSVFGALLMLLESG